MIPAEMFAEDVAITIIRYGLYFGAVFQVLCFVACVTLSDEPSDYMHYYDKVNTDSDDCSSEQSSPGHRASSTGKGRKQEKKKRR